MRKKECCLLLVCFVLFILCLPMLTQAQGVKKEFIVAQFTFEPGAELNDLAGNFPDLTLMGGATVEKGQLKVSTGKWAVSSPMKKGPSISEKTMISWCYIDNLTVLAGSVLTLDQIAADQFDAMVFGERQPQKWMAGSSNFTRTQDAAPGFQETKTGILIYLAYSYQKDGATNRVRLYRDGELFGDYSLGTVPTWAPGDAEIFFGKRHGNAASGGPGDLEARIEEARIYNTVLSQAEIKELQKGAFAVGPSGKLATLWGDVKVK
jgi:hypothetical protein